MKNNLNNQNTSDISHNLKSDPPVFIYIFGLAMNLLIISLYALVSFYLLVAWLRFFRQGRGMSDQQKVLSLLTIGIATVFWPLVLPIAYVKLLDATASQS